MQHPVLPGVHKIAVLRANAIGDLIFILPALEALRGAYPQAEIVFLGQPWHVRFLTGRPGPWDRVLAVPPSRGVNDNFAANGRVDEAALDRFFAEMEAEHFDLALQMHGGGRYSNPFVRRLGARVAVGAKTPDAAELDRWVPYVYWQLEILRCLEIVGLVGARTPDLEPRLALTEADQDEAARLVPQTNTPLVALHPGASTERRRWPAQKFAAVGDALAAQGARVLVTGAAPNEQPIVAAVVRHMRAPASDLWGQLSLGGLAALLARCRLVVSNDSGPLHLAGAVGAPTVGIYWAGNLITAGPPFRARHRPLLSWRVPCPVCGRDTITDLCEHEVSLVADVPVEEVVAAALELWTMDDRR